MAAARLLRRQLHLRRGPDRRQELHHHRAGPSAYRRPPGQSRDLGAGARVRQGHGGQPARGGAVRFPRHARLCGAGRQPPAHQSGADAGASAGARSPRLPRGGDAVPLGRRRQLPDARALELRASRRVSHHPGVHRSGPRPAPGHHDHRPGLHQLWGPPADALPQAAIQSGGGCLRQQHWQPHRAPHSEEVPAERQKVQRLLLAHRPGACRADAHLPDSHAHVQGRRRAAGGRPHGRAARVPDRVLLHGRQGDVVAWLSNAAEDSRQAHRERPPDLPNQDCVRNGQHHQREVRECLL
mmetsp:Transcript_150838/g.366367  ORF Transcript_150838/g.366367 Transcript_150838/m.366367 type:complete len:297 (+) Transcript_150838:2378-3268(+)